MLRLRQTTHRHTANLLHNLFRPVHVINTLLHKTQLLIRNIRNKNRPHRLRNHNPLRRNTLKRREPVIRLIENEVLLQRLRNLSNLRTHVARQSRKHLPHISILRQRALANVVYLALELTNLLLLTGNLTHNRFHLATIILLACSLINKHLNFIAQPCMHLVCLRPIQRVAVPQLLQTNVYQRLQIKQLICGSHTVINHRFEHRRCTNDVIINCLLRN